MRIGAVLFACSVILSSVSCRTRNERSEVRETVTKDPQMLVSMIPQTCSNRQSNLFNLTNWSLQNVSIHGAIYLRFLPMIVELPAKHM